MKNLILLLSVAVLLSACGSPEHVAPFVPENDLSSDLVSEKSVNDAGCRFDLSDSTVLGIRCERAPTSEAAYDQRVALAKYAESTDLGSTFVRSQTETTRMQIVRKNMAAYLAVFGAVAGRFPFEKISIEPPIKRFFYVSLLEITQNEQVLVSFDRQNNTFELSGSSRPMTKWSFELLAELRNAVKTAAATVSESELNQMLAVIEKIEALGEAVK